MYVRLSSQSAGGAAEAAANRKAMPAFQAPTGSNRWHSSLMAPLTLQPVSYTHLTLPTKRIV